MKARNSHGKADYIGIAGSVLCIIHCILVPVIAIGGSLSHEHHHHGGFMSLDYFFILINGIAVYFATKEHGSTFLQYFLWSAFSLFAISLVFEGVSPIFNWLGYAGSALLIVGHFANLYLCRFAHKPHVA